MIMKSMLRAITKKYRLMLLSISLAASLGFALTAGLSSGYLSLERSLDSYLSDYGYPDGVITTEVTSVSDAKKIRDIPGVEAVYTCLCADTMMRAQNGEYLAARVFSYTDQDRQKFHYWEQADDEGRDSVLLEYNYAKSHNISAGDTVSFKIRDEYRPFFVAGIVSRPETLYAKFSDRAWGLNYDFGFAYMKRSLLAREYERDLRKEQGKLDEKAEELDEERNEAERLLEEKEKELAAARLQLEEESGRYYDTKEKVEREKKKLRKAQDELTALAGQLEEKKGALEKEIGKIEKGRKELETQRKTLMKDKKALEEYDGITEQLEGLRELLEEYGLLTEEIEKLLESLADYDRLVTQVESLLESLEELKNSDVIADLRSRPPETPLQEAIDLEYLRSLVDFDALEKYLCYRIPLEEMTVGEALKMFDDAAAAAEDILKKLIEPYVIKQQIDQALDALDQAIREADKGLSVLRETQETIDRNEDKARSQIRQIDGTLLQIDRKIKDAGDQIADASKLIQEGGKALSQKKAAVFKEFAGMEKKLDRAYEKLEESEGYDRLCNRFLLYIDDDADSQNVLSRACGTFDAHTDVISSYTYEESPVKQRIDINLDPIRTLTVYCPMVFFLITLGTTFMFMSMIIRQSRRQIGILRALGMSRGWIRTLFCAISVMVALAGILIGCGIGAGLMFYVGGYYQDFFPLPVFRFEISWTMCLIGAATTLGVCLAATLITTRSISSIVPREAMSRRNQAQVMIPAWADRLTRRMRPLSKFSLTSLLRNKGRFVFSSVIIAVSIMLIISSLSFIAAKNHTIQQVFDERIHYDCQVFLEDAPESSLVDRMNDLEYVTDAQPLLYYETDIRADGEAQSAVINAIAADTKMVTIPVEEGIQKKPQGEGPSVQKGKIILERHLASDLCVGPGDTVTVNGTSLTVSAISDQSANQIQYVSLEDADLLGSPDLGCVICNLPQQKHQDLMTWLMDEDIDGYLYTMFMASFFRYNKEVYEAYDTSAGILIWFSVLLGFVILLNTAVTNLMDTRRELCVLRSLGFRHGDISRSRFSQTVLQYLISCPVGLIAGAIVAKWILFKISTPYEEYAFSSGFPEYGKAIGIVLVYLILCHLLAMRSMRKWDIPGIVKDRE